MPSEPIDQLRSGQRGLGDAAAVKLEDVEARIERHLASLLALASRAPMPSLRLIQAPVFHGYSFSAWVEFVDAPDMEALESSLSIPAIEVANLCYAHD